PKIYQVNWFRKDRNGSYIWPGFGDNSRVLEWIVRRVVDQADAVDTPVGRIPAEGELDLDGLSISDQQMAELFAVNTQSWLAEADLTEEFYGQFGDRVPSALHGQLGALRTRLLQA
ncbi:MAG: phosphoenolpyruvate carboxykinase domain-containing protein, partial [Actinomycetota bacterium]